FDYLGAGEKLTLTYTVQLSVGSAFSGDDTQTVTITVIGTNDRPVIATDATARVYEKTLTTGSTASDTATASLSFTDADLSDTQHWLDVTKVVASDNTSGLTLTSSALRGLLSVGIDPTSSHDGKINWTFNAADKTFDYLAAGEKLTLTYTVQL